MDLLFPAALPGDYIESFLIKTVQKQPSLHMLCADVHLPLVHDHQNPTMPMTTKIWKSKIEKRNEL